MYLRTPASQAEQQELQQEMRLLGIEADKIDDIQVVFWQEHQAALNWWWQVQDLMRYQDCVCLGLDVTAVKADSDLSGREVVSEDYQKLKLIAHTVTEALNRQLASR